MPNISATAAGRQGGRAAGRHGMVSLATGSSPRHGLSNEWFPQRLREPNHRLPGTFHDASESALLRQTALACWPWPELAFGGTITGESCLGRKIESKDLCDSYSCFLQIHSFAHCRLPGLFHLTQTRRSGGRRREVSRSIHRCGLASHEGSARMQSGLRESRE